LPKEVWGDLNADVEENALEESPISMFARQGFRQNAITING
jgi:hypothetical protein